MSAKHTRPRRRFAGEEDISLSMEVLEWDYLCSLAPDDGRHLFGNGFYVQFVTLRFKGALTELRPPGVQELDVRLTGTPGLLEEKFEKPLLGIGMLERVGVTLVAYIRIPAERIPELFALATNGRVRTCTLNSTRLEYRKGTILRFSIGTLAEDEW